MPRIAAFLLSLCLLGGAMSARATEEPGFSVLRTLGDVQLRQYAGYAVAEVVVPGPAESAGSRAFPILAGYIFGKNKAGTSFAMTAPVTQAQAASGATFAMTAPVTQAPTDDGYLVQFVLPQGVTAEAAPAPLDPRVRLRQIAPRTLAAIRYSGFWSAANDEKHLRLLRDTLRGADFLWQGEPVTARYDPPWTPWFMRRNEIWLDVTPK